MSWCYQILFSVLVAWKCCRTGRERWPFLPPGRGTLHHKHSAQRRLPIAWRRKGFVVYSFVYSAQEEEKNPNLWQACCVENNGVRALCESEVTLLQMTHCLPKCRQIAMQLCPAATMTDILTEEITRIAAGKAVMQLRFLYCEVTLTLYPSMYCPCPPRQVQISPADPSVVCSGRPSPAARGT